MPKLRWPAKLYRKLVDDLSFAKKVVPAAVGIAPLLAIFWGLSVIIYFSWRAVLDFSGHPVRQGIFENILADAIMSVFTLIGVYLIFQAYEKRKDDDENLWPTAKIDFDVHLNMAVLLREWSEPRTIYQDIYLKYKGSQIEKEFSKLADNKYLHEKIDPLRDLSIQSASIYWSHLKCMNQVVEEISNILGKVKPSPDWLLYSPLSQMSVNLTVEEHNLKLLLNRARISYTPKDFETINFSPTDVREAWTERGTEDGYQWHNMLQHLRLDTYRLAELMLEIARRAHNSTLSKFDTDDRSPRGF